MWTSPINPASPAHVRMSTGSGARKRQQKVGFRIPKKAVKLCVRDEYGTRALGLPGVVLRPTALQREIELRTETRRIAAFLRSNASVLRSWAAYRESIPVLRDLKSKLNSILRRYKSRRNEIGLFYLAPRMIGSTGFTVRTHLDGKSEFLNELWRRKRQERKLGNVEAIRTVSPAQESVFVGTLRLCGMRHVLGLFAVTAFACLIVLL